MRNAVANFFAVHENDYDTKIGGMTIPEMAAEANATVPYYVQDVVLDDSAILPFEVLKVIPYILDCCITVYTFANVSFLSVFR